MKKIKLSVQNSPNNPMVIIKNRGEGYTVYDGLTDISETVSEIKLSGRVVCIQNGSSMTGRFCFRKSTHTPVKAKDGFAEYAGSLKFKSSAGDVSRKPIPAGHLYLVTRA